MGRLLLTPVVCLLFSGCFSGGLFNMDERWCAQHPHAPGYRCQRE